MATDVFHFEQFESFSPCTEVGPYRASEYWIVDSASRWFEFLILEQRRYEIMQPENDRYQSPRLPEIEIDLATFWREVDRRLPGK